MTDSIAWALGKLRQFERDATPIFVPSPPHSVGFHSYKPTAPTDEVLKSSAVIEQILDRYTLTWREVKQDNNERYRFRGVYEATQRCIALLEAQDELTEHLADPGPTLRAGALHPWVWQAAKSAWEAGLYEDAVDAAARSINTRLRAKVSRRDLGRGTSSARSSASDPAMRPTLGYGSRFQTTPPRRQSRRSTAASLSSAKASSALFETRLPTRLPDTRALPSRKRWRRWPHSACRPAGLTTRRFTEDEPHVMRRRVLSGPEDHERSPRNAARHSRDDGEAAGTGNAAASACACPALAPAQTSSHGARASLGPPRDGAPEELPTR